MPIQTAVVRFNKRFNATTDEQARAIFERMKEKEYSYPVHYGERIWVGSPTSYRYAVTEFGGIILELGFSVTQTRIWSDDPALKDYQRPRIEQVALYGYTISKRTDQPLLFDGKYEVDGYVYYTSSEYDKLVGFKVTHREREIRFVEGWDGN